MCEGIGPEILSCEIIPAGKSGTLIMKRKLLILLYIAFLTGALFSCRKKDNQDTVTFPQTVYAGNLASRSGIRMFVRDTEITDTAVIRRFIGDSKYFNLNAMDPSYYISFVSSDSAILAGYNSKFSYTLNSGLFLIFSRGYYQIDPRDHLNVLVDTIQKFKSSKIFVPAGTNLLNWARHSIWVAHGSYRDLLASGISYKISTYSGYQTGTMPNEFFEGTMSVLRPGDTVAVQSYSMYMLAR